MQGLTGWWWAWIKSKFLLSSFLSSWQATRHRHDRQRLGWRKFKGVLSCFAMIFMQLSNMQYIVSSLLAVLLRWSGVGSDWVECRQQGGAPGIGDHWARQGPEHGPGHGQAWGPLRTASCCVRVVSTPAREEWKFPDGFWAKQSQSKAFKQILENYVLSGWVSLHTAYGRA